jgi:hypothetical protein
VVFLDGFDITRKIQTYNFGLGNDIFLIAINLIKFEVFLTNIELFRVLEQDFRQEFEMWTFGQLVYLSILILLLKLFDLPSLK